MAFDYQTIIDGLDTEKIIALMTSLGAEDYKETDNAIIFHTICHNESANEASHKLYYYKNTHLFYCYSNCGGMNIFSFLKQYYETRSIIYDWRKDILGVILNCSSSRPENNLENAYKSIRTDYEPQKVRRQLDEFPKNILNIFQKFYPVEWLNDGITKKSMDKFKIRFSPTRNKIIIPHFDADGRLVGIRGRALNQWEVENFGKYMPIQIENQWYSHPLGLNLYGLNITKEAIKRSGVAILFEGEKSILQFDAFARDNVGVAVCGSNINKYQIDILLRYCQPREIIIGLDKDKQDFEKLYQLGRKYKNYCNMSFIYDKKNLLGEKDSPTDKGEKVFEQLLSERVRVR